MNLPGLCKKMFQQLGAEVSYEELRITWQQIEAAIAPTMTDLMVEPEALDAWLVKNPPPD